MDWEYIIDSEITRCVRNGIITCSLIFIIKKLSTNYYKKLLIDKTRALEYQEIVFLKNYYLFNTYYKECVVNRSSIIKNKSLRMVIYTFSFLFSHLIIKQLYYNYYNKKEEDSGDGNKNKIIDSLSLINDEVKIKGFGYMDNIIIYSLTGFSFGYLFFKKSDLTLFCSIIGGLCGGIYALTGNYYINSIKKKIEF